MTMSTNLSSSKIKLSCASNSMLGALTMLHAMSNTWLISNSLVNEKHQKEKLFRIYILGDLVYLVYFVPSAYVLRNVLCKIDQLLYTTA